MKILSDITIPIVNQLNYEEVKELIILCQKRERELYPEYSDREQKKYQQNKLLREKEKEDFNKNILPKIIKYLKENLKFGAIIKVKGTRDGKGMREFIDWGEGWNLPSLQCRQLIIDRKNKITKHHFTEHLVDKITHVQIDGKLVKIKELIK